MNSFSISQLQQFSGIKAHTIRIWEQRYNALQPERSEGNTRYYNSAQLRRLLNIVSLSTNDYKVSELCRMPDAQLNRLLEEQMKNLSAANEPYEYFISQMVGAAMDFDEAHFEKMFSACVVRFGIRQTYGKVIYPLLNRVGMMWACDSLPPAQEHFVSNLIRQKLFTALDGLPPATHSRNTWLLFLPENEFHEIGLLMANYLIRQSGKRTIYLGANVPFESLQKTAAAVKPSHLLLFFVHHDLPEKTQAYLHLLKKNFRQTTICLSGNPKLIEQLNTGKEMNWIRSMEQLEKML